MLDVIVVGAGAAGVGISAILDDLGVDAVSYTHLTLTTNREV